MRGTDSKYYAAYLDAGITPAHAGNSSVMDFFADEEEDHPRTCGEQAKIGNWGSAIKGSPPHMRGTVNGFCLCSGCVGITPAHAGNRLSSNTRVSSKRDHPRTCGEQS